MVTKKTTADLTTTEKGFKRQVREFYRSHSRLSHINIQDMVSQAINLEVESQRQRAQGEIFPAIVFSFHALLNVLLLL